MKKNLLIILFGLSIIMNGACSSKGKGMESIKGKEGIFAIMDTSKGEIVLELYYKDAPLTVANFVGLAEGKLDATNGKPFYDGLKFHRVIEDFMIQGGDPRGNGTGGPGYKFADEEVPYKFEGPGILAMANAGANTNGSQFFITHVETPWLNGKHTIFGKVVTGQDVVDAVKQGDEIKSVKVIRQGVDAEGFTATQDEWNKYAEEATRKAVAAKETPLTVLAALPDVVAEINGVPVKKQEFIDIFMKQFPDGKIPENVSVDMVRMFIPSMIRLYVHSKLEESDMKKLGFNPSETETRKYLKEYYDKLPKQPREMLNQQLSIQGKTLAQLIEEQSKDKNVQIEVARMRYAENTFLKNIKVTDEEAKNVYDKHIEELSEPATVKASHILIKVDENADDAAQKVALAKINDIKSRLAKDPSLFEAIAKSESDCSSKADGGSLGEAFPREKMVPEFSEVAFKLTPGQISDVVKTRFGYHIIRCDAYNKAVIPTFNEVKDRIKYILTKQKIEKAKIAHFENLEKEANVKSFVKETPVMPVPSVK